MSRGVYFKAPILILAFLSGVALRSFFNVPDFVVFGLLGFTLALFVFLALNFGAEARGASLCLLIFFFLLGILRFSFFENNILKDKLHEHYGEELTLTGAVLSSENKENSQRIVLETDFGRLRITKRIYPEYKYGDILEASGKIIEPVNFAAYLQNIPVFIFRIDSFGNAQS